MSGDISIEFTLRRNEPQQANVDMAKVSSPFQTGFHFLNTTAITSPEINNARFNYYIVAGVRHFDVGFCAKCSVGFCSVGYTSG